MRERRRGGEEEGT